MKIRLLLLISVIVLCCIFAIPMTSCDAKGERGLDGNDGKNAYEIAGERGFKGTIDEWLESLKGDTGEKGEPGEKGDTGEKGEPGEKGENGDSVELVNTNDTYFTLNVSSDSLYVDFRGLYRNTENAGGVTYIDWGDGTETEIINEDSLKHTYKSEGEYKVRLVGLTSIGKSSFRAQKSISKVQLGDIVTYVGEYAFNECTSLYELRINTVNPPEIEDSSFDTTNSTNKRKMETIVVPEKAMLSYVQAWPHLAYAIKCEESIDKLYTDLTVTVGITGDFETINKALEYLSQFYPIYNKESIDCVVEIQDGTIINEQIFVNQIDLSYITITTNNPENVVKVDVTGWGGVTHDTRGNRPFFSAENGGRLPGIKCLFSCIVPEGGWNETNYAVGYYCNRGSTGVILGSTEEEVGFEYFYDNIIANNNREIVLREAVARNAGRYGVLSRHISRVSARSADITGCGEIAAYADRASMMDVRCADLSGSRTAIVAYHASTITANETIANTLTGFWVIDSRQGSIINCQGIKINGANSVFNIAEGGTIIASQAVLENVKNTIFSTTPNMTSKDGIIYN